MEIVGPTGSPIAQGSGRTVLFVHGRDYKPPKGELWSLWLAAVRGAIMRDWPGKVDAFDRATKEFAYFGDHTARVLAAEGRDYDPILDVEDRCNALKRLQKLDKAKRYKRDVYEHLPAKTPFKEFLADIGAPLLGVSWLKNRVVAKVAPDLLQYWDTDGEYRRAVDERIRDPLLRAIGRGDRILLISHCLGSVAAYNVLWHFSHDTQGTDRNKVDSWITFGSPLGDNSVKKRLAGAGEKRAGRYPNNVLNWHNLSAEDDYMCHDKSIADDFKSMLDQRLVSQIRDYRIYNLAVRYGRSNPHSSLGYLTHPRMARLIADWVAPS